MRKPILSINVAITFVALVVLSSCSELPQDDGSVATSEQGYAVMNTLANSNVQIDESGNVVSVTGLVVGEDLKFGLGAEEGDASTIESRHKSLKKLLESDVPLFSYQAQEGIEAAFSTPKMVTTTAFGLNSFGLKETSYSRCKGSAFQETVPTISQLLKVAEKCGSFVTSHCIRLSYADTSTSASSSAAMDDYFGYIETPLMHFNIPCPETLFAGAALQLDEGREYTVLDTTDLKLSYGPLVSSMYVTNSPDCSSGGEWESVSDKKVAWPLAWGRDKIKASVYVTYKTLLPGTQSACLHDSIDFDRYPPTDTSVVVDLGVAYTNSSTVNLRLSATDATEMYVTNTSGCASGGVWEAYATSKTNWALAQSKATATVYAKFRDSVGNESACTEDTIIHDDTAPSSTSLSISSGATYTTSSSVVLNLAATGASQMYLTNTLGCASGGAYEAYATNKLSYALGQSNGVATVYAKFRDEAGNESDCINDTIIHDGLDPSAPNVSDGTQHRISRVELSWTPSTDSGSGLTGYEVALGTSQGLDDAVAWTDVGNVTNYTFTGLALTARGTYYALVRAVDAAGRTSAVGAGDGFIAYLGATEIAAGKSYVCALLVALLF